MDKKVDITILDLEATKKAMKQQIDNISEGDVVGFFIGFVKDDDEDCFHKVVDINIQKGVRKRGED